MISGDMPWFFLTAAASGGLIVAVTSDTMAEIVGALAGAAAGMLAALGGFALFSPPVRFTWGTAIDTTAAALWISMLGWLATLWWETLTGRIPRAR